MRLVTCSLTGRSFLLQFNEIMQEFGTEIPWLEPLRALGYTTNGAFFRDRLLKALHQEEEGIIPLQFVTPDRSREYVGSVLHFPRSPERFRDRRNQELLECLESQGASFISCLQVRDIRRGQGYGRELLQRALRVLLETHGKVWGVVSKPTLISWYVSLGFTLYSSLENQDRLWILVLDQNQSRIS